MPTPKREKHMYSITVDATPKDMTANGEYQNMRITCTVQEPSLKLAYAKAKNLTDHISELFTGDKMTIVYHRAFDDKAFGVQIDLHEKKINILPGD